MSIGLRDVLQHRAEGNRGRVWWYNPGKCSKGGVGTGFSVVEREVLHNISICRVFGNLDFQHATRALITFFFF